MSGWEGLCHRLLVGGDRKGSCLPVPCPGPVLARPQEPAPASSQEPQMLLVCVQMSAPSRGNDITPPFSLHTLLSNGSVQPIGGQTAPPAAPGISQRNVLSSKRLLSRFLGAGQSSFPACLLFVLFFGAGLAHWLLSPPRHGGLAELGVLLRAGHLELCAPSQWQGCPRGCQALPPHLTEGAQSPWSSVLGC